MAQSACLSHAWRCVLEGQALAAHSVTTLQLVYNKTSKYIKKGGWGVAVKA